MYASIDTFPHKFGHDELCYTVRNGCATRAVVINQQGNRVWANLYVNVHDGIENAEMTQERWEGKTLKGAEEWAWKKIYGVEA